ncbi:MAG TPA: hypothetical protein PKM69_01675 [Bacteroidales bacterium]|nr:hypothetical protein [Bacteroidales bacterium]
MKIDRSNYEIWLIDWLDGKLSDYQAEEVISFLNENPDIKDEFEEMASVRIEPSEKPFQQKNSLKKTFAELDQTQYEYLCIAFLENELSEDQKAELKKNIGNDSEKKRTFELIQHTKLAPGDIRYKNKNRLTKATPMQKIIRLSAIGLSAAAAVLLIILVHPYASERLPDEIKTTAQKITSDSNHNEKFVESIQEGPKATEKPVAVRQVNEAHLAFVLKKCSETEKSGPDIPSAVDSSRSGNTFIREPAIEKITVNSYIHFETEISENTLIASNYSSTVPSYNEDQSNVSRFISKTFREKILKEDNSQASPLKLYDIAEAGINGLSKLMGWNAELKKKKDEKGELKSIYFTSAILKFNIPVEKTEPTQ